MRSRPMSRVLRLKALHDALAHVSLRHVSSPEGTANRDHGGLVVCGGEKFVDLLRTRISREDGVDELGFIAFGVEHAACFVHLDSR
jgi:hypothetical protein